jgi:hypothetical protein
LRLREAYAAPRQQTIDAAWGLHNALTGAKLQVVAQYGRNSTVVQSIGWKRLIDRRRPARRVLVEMNNQRHRRAEVQARVETQKKGDT